MASGEGLTLVRSDHGGGWSWSKAELLKGESSQGEPRRERQLGGQYTALLRVGTHLKAWWKS